MKKNRFKKEKHIMDQFQDFCAAVIISLAIGGAVIIFLYQLAEHGWK